MSDAQDDEMEKFRKTGQFFANVAKLTGGIHPDPIWTETGNGAFTEEHAEARVKAYTPKPPTEF